MNGCGASWLNQRSHRAIGLRARLVSGASVAWTGRRSSGTTLLKWRAEFVTMAGMSTIGIYEAKKHFSKLLRRAMSGEEIVITRSGDPIVRLEAIGVLDQRRFGTDVGVVEVPEDFDDVAVPEIGEASQ